MVEDRILEYLDGSLSDGESAELLETLSVSPEKRTLLEEHLRLKDLLALGRKPFTVPIETERSLAERIPILGNVEGESAPLFGRFAAARSWIGARTLRLAGGAVALLLVLAVGWYSLDRVGNSPAFAGGSIAPLSHSGHGATQLNVAANALPQNSRDIPSTSALHSADPRLAHRFFRSGGVEKNLASLNTPSAAAASSDVAEKGDLIPSVAPVPVIQEPARVVPHGQVAHTMSELLLPEPAGISPISVGASFVLNQLFLPVASGASHSITAPTGDVTLDYDLSPSLAVGLDAGTAQGSALNSAQTFTQTPTSNYSRLTENPLLTNQMFYDLLLTAHFTLFPESEYQIRMGAAGGDAFGAGPVAEASAGISRVLAPNLVFDLTAIVARMWTNGNPSAFTRGSSGGVVGIVGQQVATTSLYSTSFGVSAGVRMCLPE